MFWRFVASALLVLLTLPQDASAGEWETIYTKKDIEVARKEIEDSPLMAFRGEGVVDVHISLLVSVLKDSKLGPEWVDLQSESSTIESISEDDRVIYNRYDLTWPVSDRDYVMRQITTYDEVSKVITVGYESTEHADRPENDCCVRAQAIRTFWRFQALPEGKTKVEVEVLTDPKGSLPAWLVNMIQRGWPYNSITGLSLRASKGDVEKHPKSASW
jgi:hypothetical protein